MCNEIGKVFKTVKSSFFAFAKRASCMLQIPLGLDKVPVRGGRARRADLSNFAKASNSFPWAPVFSKNTTSINSLICCLVEDRKLKK